MIEGFAPSALIILNLVNPKEKFFGVLTALSPAGVTMRGINLDSFEDWIHQIARNEEPDLNLITMFVPLFRVERIFLEVRLEDALGDVEPIFVERDRCLDQAGVPSGAE